jgi:ABC-type amino acid transport substrate-binding protein
VFRCSSRSARSCWRCRTPRRRRRRRSIASRRGSIVFSYRNAAPPFSYKDREGRIKGYSVDLCLHVAARIQKELAMPELKIEWVSVEAATRLEAVATGKVDADCGTTTISLSRMQTVDFSVPIFVDGGGVLVRGKKKPTRMADLKGIRALIVPAGRRPNRGSSVR